jgi:hypothetical protein
LRKYKNRVHSQLNISVCPIIQILIMLSIIRSSAAILDGGKFCFSWKDVLRHHPSMTIYSQHHATHVLFQ